MQCLLQGGGTHGGTALRSSERGGASVPPSTACTVVHTVHICSTSASISQVPIDLVHVVEREALIDHRSTKKQTHITPFPRETLRVRASPRAKFSCYYLAKQIRLLPCARRAARMAARSSVHSSLPLGRGGGRRGEHLPPHRRSQTKGLQGRCRGRGC